MNTAPDSPSAPVAIDERFARGCAFIDGDYVPIAEARVPILDWGFIRSDATYDVVSSWQGKFFRLEAHLERFYSSMERLRLKLPVSPDELVQVLANCTVRAGLEDAYVEMICTRGQPAWGSRDPRECVPAFYAFAVPYVWLAKPEKQLEGLHLHVSDTQRISPNSVDPKVKNYHWLDLDTALMEALDQGRETVVLTDADGNLCEGPGFNIFVVDGGRVRTPGHGVLEGVTRRTVIEMADELNVSMQEATVPVNALESADEVFVSTTAGGVIPVTTIDGRVVGDGQPGPLTMRLRETYWAWHEDPRFATPVASLIHTAAE